MSKDIGFAELFEESKGQRHLREGSDLLVQVLDINENFVTVGAALKSESRIAVEEFHDGGNGLEVQVGDTVEVEIDLLENGMGEAVLSRRNARRKSVWQEIEKAVSGDGFVEGMVQGRVRGGYSVSMEGVRAFLPGSLADIFPTPGLDDLLIGKKHRFKPIKVNRRRNSVVLSRRAVIEQEMVNEKGRDLLADYKEGTRLRATVRMIVSYGAFLELEQGICGLLHITDVSWKHTESLEEVMAVGDEVDVVVLRIDLERSRISLGMKQLQPDPWDYFERMHPVGTRTFGKVTKIVDYGVFVEIGDELQGLVHTSEMSWSRRNLHPSKLVQAGDEVEVMVLEVDQERRRISLGMKQCQKNPWQEFAMAYRKGDRVSCIIRTINEHGLFVELPGDVEGLIRLSDISYDEKSEVAVARYNRGDEVEAVIMAIEADRQRIALSIKHIGDDKFDAFVAGTLKGSMLSAKVVAIEEKGALMEVLPDKIRGFLPISEIAEERIEDVSNHVKEGETSEMVLIDIDQRNKRAILSLKAKNRKDRDRFVRDHREPREKTTQLGALLQAKDLVGENKDEESKE